MPSAGGDADTYPLSSRYTKRVPEKLNCRLKDQRESFPTHHNILPFPDLTAIFQRLSRISLGCLPFFSARDSVWSSLYHQMCDTNQSLSFSRPSGGIIEVTVVRHLVNPQSDPGFVPPPNAPSISLLPWGILVERARAPQASQALMCLVSESLCSLPRLSVCPLGSARLLPPRSSDLFL